MPAKSIISFLRSPTRLFFLLLILSAGIQLFFIYAEVKYPSTDIFVFKEAGVNFALKGHFTAVNLPHMQPEEEHVFSYYPPVYPFSFGLWSKIFGVGLFQSNSFDLVWRLLRSALLFFFCAGTFVPNRRASFLWAALIFVSSFLSTDADRPDEMSFCLGLSTVVLFLKRRYVAAIITFGLCGSTSPAGGVFAGLLLWGTATFREGFAWPTLKKLAVVTTGGVGTFFACTLPILLSDPWAYYRFSRQVPMSTFPYLEPWLHGEKIQKSIALFGVYFSPWFGVTSPYVVAALGLMVASAIAWVLSDRTTRKEFGSLFWVGSLFTLLVVVVWTRQPYYLWFSSLAFIGFLLAFLTRGGEKTGALFVTGALSLVALTPLVARETKAVWNAWQRPVEETPNEVRKRVLAHVGPHDRIAITPDQYFTFRGYRDVANLRYMCDRLDAFDYLYVTRLISSKRDSSEVIPIPCESPSPRCFVPVVNFSSNRPLTVLGKPTDYYVRGAGGTLYSNTRCTYSLKRLTQR